MALKVKSVTDSAEKWVRKAPGSVPDYIKGIEGPRRPWQAATKASVEVYNSAVVEAIGRDAFGKGVDGSSDAEHKAMSVGKGAANYPRGIRDGEPKYKKKMAPVLAHMSGITLPPGGMRGGPENIARSVAFQEAMAKFRTGG